MPEQFLSGRSCQHGAARAPRDACRAAASQTGCSGARILRKEAGGQDVRGVVFEGEADVGRGQVRNEPASLSHGHALTSGSGVRWARG
jgi:hypothetical protein